MSKVTVEIEIAAPVGAVWDELADIGSHDQWMTDAESIVFTSEQHAGVGTTIEVATRVGPLRTLDRMRFVEWVEGESMTVRHEGLVSGTGTFRLTPVADDRTAVTWEEALDFPIHFGGSLGAAVARPIFRRIWSANLRRLKARLEG